MSSIETQTLSSTRCAEAEFANAADAFPRVLDALRAVVGEGFVQDDAEVRKRRARTTLPTGTVPRVIVQPASTQEVQAVVKIAASFKFPIHPISGGKNWGYGDACALTHGQILLDLKRMNRIVEVDAELGYAIIEPGVTQGELAEYLEAHDLPFMPDATVAGPSASIVGNTLERGFGHTPHGDRFLHTCGMEIVLADGRVLKTGFGHFENAQAASVYKWGVGPYLDGIFTQSNLGIVTQMTFWLLPKPECFKAFFFSVKNPEDIGGLVDALRPLRMNGTLTTPIHIGNDLRVISMTQAYPWEEMQGQTPLSAEVRRSIGKRHGVSAWSGSGALYGSKAVVAAAEAEVRKALREVTGLNTLVFFDERRMRWARRAINVLTTFGIGATLARLFKKVELGFDLLRGRSPDNCVQCGLWRVRNAPAEGPERSADPLDHNAGFLWLSPVLPMKRAHIERVNALLEPIFNRYGFDYLTTFSMVTARSLCAVTTIAFDKSIPDERRRASACHAEALGALVAEGYIPYRMGNSGMEKLGQASSVYFDVTARIKSALDPHGIISPGHYQPNEAR